MDKLIGKKKIKGDIYFNVLWKSGEKTWKPRKTLIKDIPILVNNYEAKLKK
jgi:hypothetical protein